MTKAVLTIISSLLFIFGVYHSNGQGCSDAGFCTMNSFKPNSNDSLSVMNNQFKLGAFYGKADNSILVCGSYLEYNRQLNNRLGSMLN